jgi:predicted transcriptional regulator
MAKENAKERAHDLYVRSDMPNDQIASMVGVSRRTVSEWISSNDWAHQKHYLTNTPYRMIVMFEKELERLTEAIAARPVGQQVPNWQEVRIRFGILNNIKQMRSRVSIGASVDVLISFVEYLRLESPDDADIVKEQADLYVEYLTKKDISNVAGMHNPRPGQLEYD